MKATFRKYDKKTINPLFQTFKSKDKKLIEDYLVLCGGTAGKTTIAKYRRILIKICDVFDGDLDKIDLKRLRAFLNVVNQSDLLPPTKNEIRKVLKRFLKENYDDWNLRFKQLKDIKGEKEINQKKINDNTILKTHEVEALMRGEENLKYKAMIMLMFETAGRPEEILKLKWKDINLEEGDVKLQSSKTGNLRINPLQHTIIHMERYKQEYPFVNVHADDYIFPCITDRNKHLSVSPVGTHLKNLGKKILKRSIFPYLIRHTRLNQLQQILPAKVYEKFADHSIETATRYSHLNKGDVRKAMFDKVYKVKEISEEKKHKLEEEVKKLKEWRTDSEHILKQILSFLTEKQKSKLIKIRAR